MTMLFITLQKMMQTSPSRLLKACFYTAMFSALVGCSSQVSASHSTAKSKVVGLNAITTSTKQSASQAHHQTNQSKDATKVLSVYRKWAGTRYRLGGTTKAGIDCSAFVRTVMSNAFNVHLPRTTTEQKHAGKSISKQNLRPGDLVFFRKNHHVGIYIGNGKFVHSGSSRGVTTSSLSNSYWSRNYTQSRRIL